MSPTQYEHKQTFVCKSVMLLGTMISVRAHEDDVFLRHLDILEHEIQEVRRGLTRRRFVDEESSVKDEEL